MSSKMSPSWIGRLEIHPGIVWNKSFENWNLFEICLPCGRVLFHSITVILPGQSPIVKWHILHKNMNEFCVYSDIRKTVYGQGL